MSVDCHSTLACLSSFYSSAKQSLAEVVTALNKVRSDPEGFQRICLVALSILQGINYYTGKHYLPDLVRVLDTANALDFYGFLKIPYHLFNTLDSDKIDEGRTLDVLEDVLCRNWNQGSILADGRRQDPQVRVFAQDCLSGLLDQMHENDWAYQDSAVFKQALYTWLVEELRLQPRVTWDVSLIDLAGLQIIQKEDSWLETLTNATFMVVDTLCIPAFLQEWNIINLSRQANWLGQFRLFSWVPNQKLDDWIRVGLCLGFLLGFLEAARCLCESNLGRVTRMRAKWSLAVSAAEFVFNFAILCQARLPVIIGLTFIAKSIGVFSIVYRPQVRLLEQD
ncbi:hypothetical protein [Candidatus Protochlamydia phocaeensis]|uniref:hypothetical protein n=1 Tax=Candidatus Protochlamydia phocaeensis TaxID=1414722 RepID=UPI000837ED04|nr:hypothetical protein [Candidatus Protochlamydia phocaeensis]